MKLGCIENIQNVEQYSFSSNFIWKLQDVTWNVITQCYLSPYTSEHTYLNPRQTGPPQRDGRLSWCRWLVTYRDGLPAHSEYYHMLLILHCDQLTLNKISKTGVTRCQDFTAKMHQIRFPLCPRHCWGSLQCSSRPPSWI